MNTKRCTMCGETKTLTEFPISSKAKGTYRNLCKPCYSIYQRDYWTKRRAEGTITSIDPLATKRCTVCKKEKPILEFQPASKGGVRSNCRICEQVKKRERRAQKRAETPGMRPYNPVRIDPITGEKMKFCTRCNQDKNASNFCFTAGRLKAYCRSCEAKLTRELYWNDPEKYRTYAKEWAAKNPDKIRLWRARWYIRNRPRLLDHYRQYNLNRRENQRSYNQRRRSQPGWYRAYYRRYSETIMEAQYRRRARLAGAPILDRAERWQIIKRDKSTCYLCGKKLKTRDCTLDHVIPLARGGAHSLDNLRVACGSCNSRKGAMTAEEYLRQQIAMPIQLLLL